MNNVKLRSANKSLSSLISSMTSFVNKSQRKFNSSRDDLLIDNKFMIFCFYFLLFVRVHFVPFFVVYTVPVIHLHTSKLLFHSMQHNLSGYLCFVQFHVNPFYVLLFRMGICVVVVAVLIMKVSRENRGATLKISSDSFVMFLGQA